MSKKTLLLIILWTICPLILAIYGFYNIPQTRPFIANFYESFLNYRGETCLIAAFLCWGYALFRYRNFLKKKYKLASDWFYLKAFLLLQPFFKQNSYLLADCLFGKTTECVDAYPLFAYMQKKGIPSYYVVWKESYFYKELLEKGKLKDIIVVNEKHGNDIMRVGFKALLHTRLIYNTHATFGDWNSKLHSTLKNNKRIVHFFAGHGITFQKKRIFKFYNQVNFDKFLVTSENERNLVLQEGNWKPEDIVLFPYPRWTNLKKEPHSQKNIFIFFTFRSTFYKIKQYRDTEYYKRIYNLLTNKRLQEKLQANNIKILYGLHHAFKEQCGIDFRFTTMPPNVEYADISKISTYLGKTDLFITDYSSLAFDFMFLETPTIFYRFGGGENIEDKEDFIFAKGQDKFLYNSFYSEEGTVDKICYYIDNDFKLEPHYKAIASRFFPIKEDILQYALNRLESLR